MFLPEQPGSRYRGCEAIAYTCGPSRPPVTGATYCDSDGSPSACGRSCFRPPRPAAPDGSGKRAKIWHVRHLQKNGYKITLPETFVRHMGARSTLSAAISGSNELVFVEVKTRTSEDFGRPLDAVDRKKRRLISSWRHDSELRMLDMPDIVSSASDVVEVVISSPQQRCATSKTPFACRITIPH